MQDRHYIKKLHEEKAKKQYIQEATELYRKLKDYVDFISGFDLKEFVMIENEIQNEPSFMKKLDIFTEKYLPLFHLYEKVYKAAKSAYEIINENYNVRLSNLNPELDAGKLLVESILAMEGHINSFHASIEDQRKSLVELQELIQSLNNFFADIEKFRQKDFYDYFGQYNNVELISEKVKNLIDGFQIDGIHQAGLLDFIAVIKRSIILSNSEELITKLIAAKDKLALLVDNLSDLSKSCEKNIILPASDLVWDVKNACELALNRLEGTYSSQSSPVPPTGATETIKEFNFFKIPKDILNSITPVLSDQDIANLRLTSSSSKWALENAFTQRIKNKLFIKQIDCSPRSCSVVLRQDGTLWMLEKDETGGPFSSVCEGIKRYPARIPFPHGEIEQVSIGTFHALILCKSGEVYGIGDNSYGQLLQGNMTKTNGFVHINIHELQPSDAKVKKVIAIANYRGFGGSSYIICEDGSLIASTNKYSRQPFDAIKLRSITDVVEDTETGHSIFNICENGQLYARGYNFYGQLGIPNTKSEIINQPTLIKDIPFVKQVCAGYLSTIIVCEDGKVLSCGEGGTNGFADKKYRDAFTVIPNLPPIKEVKMSKSSTSYCTFLLAYDGSVYVFGRSSDKNELLNGIFKSNRDIWAPVRIPNLPRVKTLATGSNQVIFLCEDGTLISAGPDGLKPLDFFNREIELYNRLTLNLEEKRKNKLTVLDLQLREYVVTKILTHLDQLNVKLAKLDPNNKNHAKLINEIAIYNELKFSLLNSPADAIDQIKMAAIKLSRQSGHSFFKKYHHEILLQDAEIYKQKLENEKLSSPDSDTLRGFRNQD